MKKEIGKYYCCVSILLCTCYEVTAQKRYSILPVRIPYSASLNQTFGQGPSNNGQPLPPGKTGFNFTTASCPGAAQYTIVNKTTCPTWVQPKFCNFHGPLKNPGYWDTYFFRPEDSSGYVMYVNNTGSATPVTVFRDTVKNLCGGTQYKFLAALIPAVPFTSVCHGPDFTFSVKTLSGAVLQLYTAKDIDYNAKFLLPPGESACVVSIVVEPFPQITPQMYCQSEFAIDDIQLIPYGPQPNIKINGQDSLVYVTGTCYQSGVPVVLNSSTDSVFVNMFTGKTDTVALFNNPAFQWEISTDDGIEWNDIPGAVGPVFSHNFTVPDTVLLRLRTSEAAVIANSNCSVVSNIIKVQIDGPPTGYKLSSNSPVCAGTLLQLSAEGGASYIWTGPNGFYDNTPYATVPSPSLKDSGIYHVRVFSFGGCYADDSIRVSIKGTDVHAGPDTSVCKGQPVRLQGTRGVSQLWSPATGLSDATLFNPVATASVTTVYTIKVTDQFGCTDTAQTTITVLNKNELHAGISGSAYLCRSTDSAYFSSSSQGDISQWRWDFGNGQQSISAVPKVQYYAIPPGRLLYRVSLKVTDTAGCTDSTSIAVQVVDNCYIAVPNAFTPNGDGLNDYLYPVNAYKAAGLSFRVFNRFGELVFSTRDRNVKWDGTVNGTKQPAGTYVWILAYENEAGKKIVTKGFTLLLR